jgi:hypothetical protein
MSVLAPATERRLLAAFILRARNSRSAPTAEAGVETSTSVLPYSVRRTTQTVGVWSSGGLQSRALSHAGACPRRLSRFWPPRTRTLGGHAVKLRACRIPPTLRERVACMWHFCPAPADVARTSGATPPVPRTLGSVGGLTPLRLSVPHSAGYSPKFAPAMDLARHRGTGAQRGRFRPHRATGKRCCWARLDCLSPAGPSLHPPQAVC